MMVYDTMKLRESQIAVAVFILQFGKLHGKMMTLFRKRRCRCAKISDCVILSVFLNRDGICRRRRQSAGKQYPDRYRRNL
jgi:hypothetical protein